jgi:hypothetical protein
VGDAPILKVFANPGGLASAYATKYPQKLKFTLKNLRLPKSFTTRNIFGIEIGIIKTTKLRGNHEEIRSVCNFNPIQLMLRTFEYQ